MRLALSRRTTLVLASIVAVGGLLELLAGQPTPDAGGGRTNINADEATRFTEPEHAAARTIRDSTLTAAAAQLLLALAHRTTDASKSGDLFASQSWYVAPPPPHPHRFGRSSPSAPPFPYTFVGSYNDGSSATVYFLTRNDRVYDVRLGDTLDQIYSVDAVENGQLVFTYKPLSIRQTLPVGGGS